MPKKDFDLEALDGWSEQEDKELRRLLKKRMSMKRSYDYDLKYAADVLDGEQYEQKLAQILNGHIEVKTQKTVNKTKNVFVEVTDKGRPSGVMTSKSKWHAQIFEGEGFNGEVIVLIRTDRLKRITEKHWYVKGGDNSTGAKVNRNSLLFSDDEIDKFKGK